MKYLLIALVIILILLLVTFNRFRSFGNTEIDWNKAIILETSFDKNQNYILLKNSSVPYIEAKIKEYNEFDYGNNQISYQIFKDSNWLIIKPDTSISFFNFHNLLIWFHGIYDMEKNPVEIIGLSLDNKKSNKSYYCILDKKNNFGDTIIGRFEDGEEFIIYIPEYLEGGKMTGNQVILNKEKRFDTLDISAFLKQAGFNLKLSDISKLKVFKKLY